MTHLFVLLIKLRQYLRYFLSCVCQSIHLTAEEGTQFCLSLLMFSQAYFEQLHAQFHDLILKCKCKAKEFKKCFPESLLIGLHRLESKTTKGYV